MCCLPFFFFNATPTTEIYTLSLHDALPIYRQARRRGLRDRRRSPGSPCRGWDLRAALPAAALRARPVRSEEHTSELQSRGHLVCRLLLEKKKKTHNSNAYPLPSPRTSTQYA